METLIAQGLTALGVETSPEAAEKLAEYGRLMLEKNQVMNLTAITDPEQVARLHMLDCAALLGCADFADTSLVDVGTGAGFPGVVLKICRPSLQLTLLDSLEKRLSWLEELCGVLGLEDVRFIHGRAEEQGLLPALREQFDYATARAVANMSTLSELCLPFVKVGGRFLAMKSMDSCEELTGAEPAVRKLGGKVESLYDYEIPFSGIVHRVAVIEKEAATPNTYPRRWAKMQKMPL